MKLAELVQVSASVAATSGRLEKISKLAGLLSRLSSEEVPIAVGFLIGWPRQGKVGVGWSTITSARGTHASTPSLELTDVDSVLSALTKVRGKNSGAERARVLGNLFARATEEEQLFLGGLLVGEVR